MDRHRRRRERPSRNVSPAHRRARLDRASHPAARLRAVGAGRVHPRGGAGRPRPRRHAVRHRRLADRGAAARRGPARLRGGSRRRRQGVRGPAQRGGVRAGRRVRPDEQPVRLPAADLQPAGVDAGRDDHPRLLVGADRAGLPRLRRHRALRRDQRCGPPSGPDLRRDDPPRHRPLPLHLPRSARGLPAVPRPHPSRQGHPPGDRGRPPGRVCRWSSPGSCRTRTTSGSSVEPHLGAPGRQLRRARSGRPSGTRCWVARWRCCTSSASPSRSGCRSSSRWPPGRR